VTPQARIDQISTTLEAIRPGWPYLLEILKDRAHDLTISLVGENNEQTRGRIKQLTELMNLPETLQQEREGISAGLAE
jgi:hypothetical protein